MVIDVEKNISYKTIISNKKLADFVEEKKPKLEE
jgi:hypothetical protein